MTFNTRLTKLERSARNRSSLIQRAQQYADHLSLVYGDGDPSKEIQTREEARELLDPNSPSWKAILDEVFGT